MLVVVETAQPGGEGFGRDTGLQGGLGEHVAQHDDVAPALAGHPGPEVDRAAALLGSYRHVSLSGFRLGPLIQQLTEISVRHRVRLPSTLTLIGKAFG